MSEFILDRRSVLKMGIGLSAVALGASFASIFSTARGEAGGAANVPTDDSSIYIWENLYYMSRWEDNGGFDTDGSVTADWGWGQTSIDNWWNYWVNPTACRITGESGPREDHGSEEWHHKTPYEVFNETAWDAINLAMTRGGTRARVVGVGCFMMSTKYDIWQFAEPNKFGGTLYNFETYFDIPNSSELRGEVWEGDSEYAGGQAGESWREFVYRRAHNDVGDGEHAIIVIAVNDKEQEIPYGSIELYKKTVNNDVTSTNDNYNNLWYRHNSDGSIDGVNFSFFGEFSSYDEAKAAADGEIKNCTIDTASSIAKFDGSQETDGGNGRLLREALKPGWWVVVETNYGNHDENGFIQNSSHVLGQDMFIVEVKRGEMTRINA